jgi:hypothetical protein
MADAPAAPAPAPASGGGGKGKVENPTTVLILGLVTCGLYTLYWMWLRVKEANDYLGKQAVNPMFVVPGCLCGPVYIYAIWLFVNALPEVQKKAGVEAKDEKILHVILMILLPGVGSYLIQQKLNEVWAK